MGVETFFKCRRETVTANKGQVLENHSIGILQKGYVNRVPNANDNAVRMLTAKSNGPHVMMI